MEAAHEKWFCALGMMLALLMSVALADGVKVTFAEKTGKSTAAMIIR